MDNNKDEKSASDVFCSIQPASQQTSDTISLAISSIPVMKDRRELHPMKQLNMFTGPPRYFSHLSSSSRPQIDTSVNVSDIRDQMIEGEKKKYDAAFHDAQRAYGWVVDTEDNILPNFEYGLTGAAEQRAQSNEQAQDRLRAFVSKIDEMTLKSSWERAHGDIDAAAMIYFQTRANAVKLLLQQQGTNKLPEGRTAAIPPDECVGASIQDALQGENGRSDALRLLLGKGQFSGH